MSSLQTALITEVIQREGGYSNRSNDRGGKTKYGITEKVAQNHGYTGDMKNLPYTLAFEIYSTKYWDSLKLDQISKVSSSLALQLFDFGVNSGVSTASKTLQQVLNVLNNQQAHYADLKTDGILGSKTLIALNQYSEHRKADGLHLLSEAIRAKRISFCIDIALKDQSQESNSYGWLKRTVYL